MSFDEATRRHRAAQHAMQTGVRLEIESDPPTQSVEHMLRHLKHERVGINTALCDHGALVTLLVRKGVITMEEYSEIIAEFMELEQQRYEDRIGIKLG